MHNYLQVQEAVNAISDLVRGYTLKIPTYNSQLHKLTGLETGKSHDGYILRQIIRKDMDKSYFYRQTSNLILNDDTQDKLLGDTNEKYPLRTNAGERFGVREQEFYARVKEQFTLLLEAVVCEIALKPGSSQADIAKSLGLQLPDENGIGNRDMAMKNMLDILESQNIVKCERVGRRKFLRTGENSIKNYSHKEPVVLNKYVGSKGEAQIAQLLIKYGIAFDNQWTHPDCKDKKLLRFDFCCTDEEYGGSQFMIEVNGIQHYEYIPYFHKSEEDYNKQQRHMDMKKKFAAENDYSFYEIRYDGKTDIVKQFTEIMEKHREDEVFNTESGSCFF